MFDYFHSFFGNNIPKDTAVKPFPDTTPEIEVHVENTRKRKKHIGDIRSS